MRILEIGYKALDLTLWRICFGSAYGPFVRQSTV